DPDMDARPLQVRGSAMARTNRDYWMACLRACVGVGVITVGFVVLAVMILRSPTADQSGDLQKVFGLWGAAAVVLPLFLFLFSKAREGAEPASAGTKIVAGLLTAGFTFGLTAVCWAGLWFYRLKQGLEARDWPPEVQRSFVESCAQKAPRPMCVC